MTRLTSWWGKLSQEEKQKILDRKYARQDRTRHGCWKGRKHWTETATPEQLAAWKAKVKAGRDKFWEERNHSRGRPRRFNYKPGWDRAKRSAASKEIWHKWDIERPNARKNFGQCGARIRREVARKNRLLAEKKAKEAGISLTPQVEETYEEKQKRLYDLACQAMMGSGVPVPQGEDPEYYQEIIDYFAPWLR